MHMTLHLAAYQSIHDRSLLAGRLIYKSKRSSSTFSSLPHVARAAQSHVSPLALTLAVVMVMVIVMARLAILAATVVAAAVVTTAIVAAAVALIVVLAVLPRIFRLATCECAGERAENAMACLVAEESATEPACYRTCDSRQLSFPNSSKGESLTSKATFALLRVVGIGRIAVIAIRVARVA